MARPSAYRVEVVNGVLSALRSGATHVQAAQAAGIGERTLRRMRSENAELRQQMDAAETEYRRRRTREHGARLGLVTVQEGLRTLAQAVEERSAGDAAESIAHEMRDLAERAMHLSAA